MLALIIAHETGHRIGAIRSLRWSDIDLEAEIICWRGSADKTGKEHSTPISEGGLNALKEAQRLSLAIGEALGTALAEERL